MANPYGRNEEKGPTFTLAELFGQSKPPPKPPAAREVVEAAFAERPTPEDQPCPECGGTAANGWHRVDCPTLRCGVCHKPFPCEHITPKDAASDRSAM